MLNEREQAFLKVLDQPFFNDEKGIIHEEKIDELYKSGEHMVNYFGFRPEALAASIQDDPLTRCNMRYIALEWIHFHAENGYADCRNESAMQRIKLIYSIDIYQEEYQKYFGQMKRGANFETVAKIFVEKSRSMHRTLMQTFSGLIFCFLILNDPNINSVLRPIYGSDWYKLPLI